MPKEDLITRKDDLLSIFGVIDTNDAFAETVVLLKKKLKMKLNLEKVERFLYNSESKTVVFSENNTNASKKAKEYLNSL